MREPLPPSRAPQPRRARDTDARDITTDYCQRNNEQVAFNETLQ